MKMHNEYCLLHFCDYKTQELYDKIGRMLLIILDL